MFKENLIPIELSIGKYNKGGIVGYLDWLDTL